MEIIENIIGLIVDDSIKGWARVAIFAILAFAGVSFYWIKSMKADLGKVKNTLMENNSGSHIKDQLDRIEKVQHEHSAILDDQTVTIEQLDERLDTIENGTQTKLWPF